MAAAIKHLESGNGPLKSVRIVRKDTASKPCGHSRWSRYYKLVGVVKDIASKVRQLQAFVCSTHTASASAFIYN